MKEDNVEGTKAPGAEGRRDQESWESEKGVLTFCHSLMPLITLVFKVMSLQPDVPRCELEDLAEISRPGSTWKRHRNGTRGGAVQSNHTRTNWYHPCLWPSIDKMAKRANWSPQETVK